MKAVARMQRAYRFAFSQEPEGGFTVTCPALPGLVTYGRTLEEAREMGEDAANGLIELMLERGETIPESDA
jgi:predicted RNase H-like HicB family nuclease